MKYTLLFAVALVLHACTPSVKEKSASQDSSDPKSTAIADSIEAVAAVQGFFDAFDARDLTKLDSILAPSSKIFHYDGSTTNRGEMIQLVQEASEWWPRKRNLTDFEFTTDGKISILGLKNDVDFTMTNGKTMSRIFLETWILEKYNNVWKPIRCHYTIVSDTIK